MIIRAEQILLIINEIFFIRNSDSNRICKSPVTESYFCLKFIWDIVYHEKIMWPNLQTKLHCPIKTSSDSALVQNLRVTLESRDWIVLGAFLGPLT